jgi:hypothetical protein
MYGVEQWPTVWIGFGLIIISVAALLRRRTRSRPSRPWYTRHFLIYASGAIGAMLVLTNLPDLLGAPLSGVPVLPETGQALGIIGVILLGYSLVILLLRGVRRVFAVLKKATQLR